MYMYQPVERSGGFRGWPQARGERSRKMGKKPLRMGIFCISVEASASLKADGEEPSKVIVIFFFGGNFLPKKMHRTNQKPESMVALPSIRSD